MQVWLRTQVDRLLLAALALAGQGGADATGAADAIKDPPTLASNGIQSPGDDAGAPPEPDEAPDKPPESAVPRQPYGSVIWAKYDGA